MADLTRFIALDSIIPLRKEPNHRSEQVSQILYGESFTVINSYDDWIEVVLDFDQYRGFFAKSHHYDIDKGNERQILKSVLKKIEHPYGFLFAGSEIEKTKIYAENEINIYSVQSVIDQAMLYLNAPYLWGGRTVAGIDCSGLIQIIHKVFHVNLPRDAKDQALLGLDIDFDKKEEGDLVFFSNLDHRIIHVGLYIGNHQIIHSSGFVKINTLNAKGIELKDGNYSHFRPIVKRLKIII